MVEIVDEDDYYPELEKLYDDKAGMAFPRFEGSGGSPARLLTRKSSPMYLRRAYIFTGYLVGGTSWEATVKTLMSMNNETLNAWTMIVAAGAAICFYKASRKWFPGELLPFAIFLASCILHTPFSVGLHCTIGVSEWHREVWRTADVFFIFTCSAVRAVAMAWYVFRSQTSFGVFIAGVGAVWLYCIASTMVLRRLHQTPKMTLTMDIGLMVFTYTIPALVEAGREVVGGQLGTACWLYGGMWVAMCFASGSYAVRWPERWWPGRFDLVGNSHQMMHVGVGIAYFLEWLFLVRLALDSSASSHPNHFSW
eukprot:jgi/Botrbrau1/7072/Bobra.0165s0094.1